MLLGKRIVNVYDIHMICDGAMDIEKYCSNGVGRIVE